jgi:hypothetical protein
MLQRKRCDPFRRSAYVGGGIKMPLPEAVHDKNLQRTGFTGLFWQKYLVEHIFAGHYPSVRHDSEISFVSLVAYPMTARFNRRKQT